MVTKPVVAGPDGGGDQLLCVPTGAGVALSHCGVCVVGSNDPYSPRAGVVVSGTTDWRGHMGGGGIDGIGDNSKIVEAVMRVFETDVEVWWAAGFFDGEGSVHGNHKEGKRRKDGTRRVYSRISVSNTERSLLVRFKLALGNRGCINGPYPRNGGRTTPIWHWTASHKTAREVAALLIPRCAKRKQHALGANYENF